MYVDISHYALTNSRFYRRSCQRYISI